MDLAPDDIAAYQKTWKLVFGEDITPEHAQAELGRLLDFFVFLVEHDDGPNMA